MYNILHPDKDIKKEFANDLSAKGDFFLTAVLLALALIIVCIALFQHNKLFKAAVILWVVIP